jgi:outer membrane protein assembly factor BamB
VGCGEGEGDAFGFVYCLNAHDGHVKWLFSTNKFSATDNEENVIPASAVTHPLPAGFTTHPDPAVMGVSVWSSCAYDKALKEIFVGTGNSATGLPGIPLPDIYYGSGVLALDADTGEFRGFFEPSPSDSYRIDPEGDTDVDVPSSPLLFTHNGKTKLGIGSKNGSFFVLDAKTMKPIARRQLLPKDSANNPLPNVDPHAGFPGENRYGIFGTAAVNYELGLLFVGIGGYLSSIDTSSTPFMRALHWDTLHDAWHTTLGLDGVERYTVYLDPSDPLHLPPRGPMYTTQGEAGLSSPAVVNDIVFISTSKPALYALDAATGLSLWTAPGLGAPTPDTFILGPAIYGNYVVIGSQTGNVYIYSL